MNLRLSRDEIPTCFTLSTSDLDPLDDAAILGSCTSFGAVWRARRAGDVDDVGRRHVRGEVVGLGVPVPIEVGEVDGDGFGHGWALFQGDF